MITPTCSDEVATALAEGRPVVALESTIFSNLGLPSPANGEALDRCAAAIRDGGAIPAVTAVLDGTVRVGLNDGEHRPHPRTGPQDGRARRPGGDRPALGVRRLDGVGLGGDRRRRRHLGVRHRRHRRRPSRLRSSPATSPPTSTPSPTITVVTVCAGAKAFLDLARSLEYLETVGVPVLGWQHDWFPAFYTRSSGLPSRRTGSSRPTRSPASTRRRPRPSSGVLLAVPIPEDAELDPGELAAALDQALADCDAAGITGAAITPFVLGRIAEATDGRSIPANLALAENNARVAAQVAVAIADRLR